MVERKTTRDFRIEGDDYIAVKKDVFVNGAGKKVVQIMEEHNITTEEIDAVIDTLATKELETLEEEYDKLVNEVKEIEEEIKPMLDDPEYIKFKDEIKSEKMEKMFQTIKKEKI